VKKRAKLRLVGKGDGGDRDASVFDDLDKLRADMASAEPVHPTPERWGNAALPAKKPREPFKVGFVQVPMRWVTALADADAGGNTYRLALAVLAETFKCEQLGGDVVLSSMVTGMHRNSKGVAAKELQRLGLVRIENRRAKQSPLIHALAGPEASRDGSSTMTKSAHLTVQSAHPTVQSAHPMEHTSLILFLFLFLIESISI
jgi:hypothetical protein